MIRQTSRNSLQNQNYYSNSNTEGYLLKQVPTHNPLRPLSPEGGNTTNFPTNKPIGIKLPSFPLLEQESPTINLSQIKKRDSAGSPWQSNTSRRENIRTEPTNFDRAFTERPTEHPHLRMLYENLVQDHDQLQQEHEAMLHRHNLLMDENQNLRNQVGRLNADLGTLQKTLTNLENDFEELSSRKSRAETELEQLKRSVLTQSKGTDSQSIQKLLDERVHFESCYQATLGELKQLKQDKSSLEQEFFSRFNALESQIDNIQKECDDRVRDQVVVNAQLKEEKMLLEDEINNLLKIQKENEKEMENLRIGIQQARLSENRSNKNEESTSLNQRLNQELGLRTVLMSAEIERLHMIVTDKLAENIKLQDVISSYENMAAETQQPAKGRKSFITQGPVSSREFSSQPSASRFEDQSEELARLKSVRETMRMPSYEKGFEKTDEISRRMAEEMNQEFERKVAAFTEKFGIEKMEMQNKINELQSRKLDAETRCVLFMTEIDRLHSLVAELSQEFEKRLEASTENFASEKAGMQKKFNEAQSRLSAVSTSIGGITPNTGGGLTPNTGWFSSNTEGFSPVEKSGIQKLLNEAQNGKTDAEARCVLFMTEIDRLHTLLEELTKNHETWKNRYLALEKDHASQTEILKALQDANPDLEFEKMKKKSDEYRFRIDDLEKYIRELQNDMRNLNDKAAEDANEIQSWKRKYELLENKALKDRESLEAEINYYKDRVTELVNKEKSQLNKALKEDQATETQRLRPSLGETHKMNEGFEDEDQITMDSTHRKERAKESGFLEGSGKLQRFRRETFDPVENAGLKARESERGEVSFKTPTRAHEADTISSTLSGAENSRGRTPIRLSLKSNKPQPIHQGDGHLGKRLSGEERDVSPGIDEPESDRRARSQNQREKIIAGSPVKRTEESGFFEMKVENGRQEKKNFDEEIPDSPLEPITEEEEFISVKTTGEGQHIPAHRAEKMKQRGSIYDDILPENENAGLQQVSQGRSAEEALINTKKEADLKVALLMTEIDRLTQLLAASNESKEKAEILLGHQSSENKRLQDHLNVCKSRIQDLNNQIDTLQQSLEREKINSSRSAKQETEKSGFRIKLEPLNEIHSNREDHREKLSKGESFPETASRDAEETQRLKNVLNEREKEIVELANEKENLAEEYGRLKKAFDELEKQKKKVSPDQKMVLEAQIEKAFRREMAKLQKKHEDEVKLYEDELQNQKIRGAQLMEKLALLDEELNRQVAQSRLLEGQVDEFMAKLAIVTEEKLQTEKRAEENLSEVEKLSDEKLQLRRELETLRITAQQERDLLLRQITECEEEIKVLVVQLERYKGRDEEMELRLVMVMVELDRQLQLNQQKDAQLVSAQQHITALEKQLEEDICTLRKQHKELLESALAKLKNDHEHDMQELKEHSLKILESEKSGLQRTLRAEFEDQISKIASTHQIENASLKGEIENLIIKIKLGEAELTQRENENQRLSSELAVQLRLNEEGQRERESLRTKFEAIASELERDRINLQKDLEKDQLTIRELVNSNQELQKDISIAGKETERLNELIKEYQRKLAMSDAQHQELMELREQYENLKRNSIVMKDLSVRFEAEKVAYEARIFKLETKVNELEMQNGNLSHELKGFKELLDKQNIKADQTQQQLINKILDLDKLRNKYEECLVGLNSPSRRSNLY